MGAVLARRVRQKQQQTGRLVDFPPSQPSDLSFSCSLFADKKCPFTGDVSIRGRILTGKVISAGKMTRTIIIRRDYLVRPNLGLASHAT